MKASQERGFTLIELVVVITILGILAAFAVPRFIALDTQARIATVNGLAGSVKSAASLARGLAMANNQAATGSVTMEGQPITLLNYYPDNATIANAVNSDNTNDWTFTAGTAPAASVWVKKGAPLTGGQKCEVDYTPALANGAPVVSVVTGGC
jgi:MSHA pilin protein MshA